LTYFLNLWFSRLAATGFVFFLFPCGPPSFSCLYFPWLGQPPLPSLIPKPPPPFRPLCLLSVRLLRGNPGPGPSIFVFSIWWHLCWWGALSFVVMVLSLFSGNKKPPLCRSPRGTHPHKKVVFLLPVCPPHLGPHKVKFSGNRTMRVGVVPPFNTKFSFFHGPKVVLERKSFVGTTLQCRPSRFCFPGTFFFFLSFVFADFLFRPVLLSQSGRFSPHPQFF